MPLDPPLAAPAAAATLPLADLQGNVVRGYSFPFATFLFARFAGPPAAARAWLAGARAGVTPGTPWADGQKPKTTFNLAFTHPGLAALGVPAAELGKLPADYRNGMPAQAAELGDVGTSAPAAWDFGGPNTPPVHALLAVHGVSAAEVAARVQAITDGFGAAVTAVYTLPAAALQPDPRREHFGFRDGFGQPSIEGSGVAAIPGQGTPKNGGWADIKPGEFLLGHPAETDFPPFVPKPADFAFNGTFLVFRKLHQNVAEFRRFLADRAAAVFGAATPDKQEWVASRLVGRWRSGAPVALSPDNDDPALAADWDRNTNFDFTDDPDGLKFPVGAHIRRANPRGALPPTQLVRTHRILRRGLPYGTPLPDGVTQDDGADRGVAFMALNASIEGQFRFVQKLWINDGEFAAGLDGKDQDPVTGPQDRGGVFSFRKPDGAPEDLFDLPRFVRVRGGGYFFVPSVAALKRLADGL